MFSIIHRTFKQGCQAQIVFRANRENGLFVKQVHLEHTNHDAVEDPFQSSVFPENRMKALNAHQLQFVEMLLSINVGTSKIIEHVKETYGVYLQGYDIINFKNRLHSTGLTEQEDAINYLKSVLVKDPDASVDIITDATSTTSVVFVQTKVMKKAFDLNGEVLFLDSTYKINKKHMPLYVFMVADSNNEGKVVAYALVLNETTEVVSNIISCFVKNNARAREIIKTVLVDKDFSEINAVKEVLGDEVNILLCKWHVDRAIRRSLKGKPQGEFDEIMTLVNKMILSSTTDMFDGLIEQLKDLDPIYFHSYFHSNWYEMRHMWAGCFVRLVTTYGNLTNNFVESHNQKIKGVLDSNSSILELFQGLLSLTNRCVEKTKFTVSSLRLKKQQVTTIADREISEKIFSLFPPKKARFVLDELEKSVEKGFIVDLDEFTVFDSGKSYVIASDFNSCSCFQSTSRKLLCAHLMAFRKAVGDEVVKDSDVLDQHSRSVYMSGNLEPLEPTNCDVVVQPAHPRDAKTTTEKFRQARQVCLDIANIISHQDTPYFDYTIDVLKGLADIMRKREKIVYFSSENSFQVTSPSLQ